ncbi:MAG: hypothetical protein HOD90_09975 [Nitrospina sp.]|jgi:hypothetical protein|nr:hypothetical protein [Nitrospina sp.]MBT6600159.1 hypothetical protein [Nitrospina sp.]
MLKSGLDVTVLPTSNIIQVGRRKCRVGLFRSKAQTLEKACHKKPHDQYHRGIFWHALDNIESH